MAILEEILDRQDQMASRRSTWEQVWERVSKLVLPRTSGFNTRNTPGENLSDQQYDAFPMAALDKFAAAIEAGLMPRSSLWHKLTTGVEELDERRDVAIYLEKLNTTIWEARAKPRANFATQAHEARISLGLLGTIGMMIVPDEKGGIRYRNIHLSELFIAEDYFGFVDTVHRRFELSARQAVQTFGKDTPQKIMDKYTSGKFSERFSFIHAVMPREDYDRTMLDDQGKPFQGVYICEETKEITREEGYFESPYIVSRYATGTREIYGRSPCIQLLPDISMLQEMRRTTIDAAAMAVDPPTLEHDDASEFQLMPGGRNPGMVDDNGRPLVMPFNTGAQVNLGLDMIQDTRAQIDDGLMGAYFRVLMENPNMTATQAMLLAQQQGQMTAPVIGRQQSEWLGPMIRRESAILFRQGKHPEMPGALREYLEAENKSLEIEYISPLTRAIRSEDAAGIMKSFEMLSPWAQVDPNIFKGFDTNEIRRRVVDATGAPASILKDPDQVAQEQEAEQAQQQAQQLLQAAPVAADAAKSLAQAQAIRSGAAPGAQI